MTTGRYHHNNRGAPLVAASHVVVCSSFLDSLASYSAFALSSSCQRNLALPGALNGTCLAWNPGPYVRIFDMQVVLFLKLLRGHAGIVVGHDSQACGASYVQFSLFTLSAADRLI